MLSILMMNFKLYALLIDINYYIYKLLFYTNINYYI